MIYLVAFYVMVNSAMSCFIVWRDLKNLKLNADCKSLINERDILIGRMEQANQLIDGLRQAGVELKQKLDAKG